MKIKFKKISLTNFKGTRNRVIEFGENVTIIQGRNKVGKTTIADACWWVLFGKDSNGNTSFGIKTNGEDLKPIPHLDHIVTLTVDVDGSEVILERRYVEDWTSKRGAEEELTGHHTESFVNGCRVTETKYKEYIASLCDEGLFKVLAKSDVFFSLKAEAQRAVLIDIVGEKSPEQFANENSEFVEILKKMGGLDFTSYFSGIAYRIKEIDKSATDVESRIKELKTGIEAYKAQYDFDALEAEVAQLDDKEKTLTDKLATPTTAIEAKQAKAEEFTSLIMKCTDDISAEKVKIIHQHDDENLKKRKRVEDAKTKAYEAQMAWNARKAELESGTSGDIQSIEREMEDIKKSVCEMAKASNDARNKAIEEKNRAIEAAKKRIEDHVRIGGRYSDLLREVEEVKYPAFCKEWQENEDSLDDETQSFCPTCHQPLPESEQIRLRKERDATYLMKKAGLEEEAAQMREYKKGLRSQIRGHQELIDKGEAELESLNYELEQLLKTEPVNWQDKLKANERYQTLSLKLSTKKGIVASVLSADNDAELKRLDEIVKSTLYQVQCAEAEQIPTIEERERQSEVIVALTSEIAKFRAQRNEVMNDNSEQEEINNIRREISELKTKRDALIKSLGIRTVIDDYTQKVKSYEAKFKELQEQKASIQEERELAKEYQIAMIEDVENRVNSLFGGITFKMFNRHLNGNIEPCCKCFIGVTEYKDGSHAERVNAGLEMIDTISMYKGISVPCFVDDAEGINRVYMTQAQQIRLVVTMENEMQVIHA